MVAVAAALLGPGCAAILGIDELPAGEERDAGSDASAGGGGGLGQLGGACSPENARGCEGHASQQQLICTNGEWASNGTCSATERCDTGLPGTGLCRTVPAVCAGKQPGDRACDGPGVVACGADLVTVTAVETCAHGCASGSCVGADGGGAGGASGASGTGGAGGGGGTSGGGGTGGGTSGTGTVGTPCAPNGALACAGHAQRSLLICVGGRWASNGQCLSGQYCDSSSGNVGLCESILSACAGQAGGHRYCEGQTVKECGVDLVTSTTVTACTSGTEYCADGACTACTGSTRDCDGGASNGCEVDLNSPASCGTTCENRVTCSSTNGTATCASGACGIGCNANYLNCDGSASNGCEVNRNTNATHCGACNNACSNAPAPTCANASTLRTWSGTCSAATCSSAYTDTACPSGVCSAGACTTGTSCATSGAGLSDCGSASDESCCASLLVPGGTFYRSYDGVTYTDQSYPATVSEFRLDKFEVTVGRFRKFKAAWDGGWRPAAGAGKHTHLNGGTGLAVLGGGGYEPGWDTAWASSLGVTDANLQCDPVYATWTLTAGANERRPINCVSWYALAAFCIWDGGFLPSEAEWNYAAAGGSEQRVYPWSVPASSATIGCTQASYDCYNNACGDGVSSCARADLIFVGTKPGGNGRWGHADLGGNVWEWVLDWYAAYPSAACNDCAKTTASSSGRADRGGSFPDSTSYLAASFRSEGTPTYRGYGVGGRCARSAP